MQEQSVFSFSRILFAGLLTFAFLSFYSYFFPQQEVPQNQQASQQTTPQSPTLSQAPASSASASSEEILTIVKSKGFDLEIDSFGRIRQVYLKDKKLITLPQESLWDQLFGRKRETISLDRLPLLDLKSVRPLEVRFADPLLNQKAFSTPYVTKQKEIVLDQQPVEIVLEQNLGNFVLKKILTLYPDLQYSIKLETGEVKPQYFITNGARPIVDSDQYVFLGTIISSQDGKLEKLEDGDVEGVEDYKNSIFAASIDRYFTSLLYDRNKNLNIVVDGKIEDKSPIAFVSLAGNASLQGYIGAKNYQVLKGIYAPLSDVVEYGLISFFAKPLFLLLEILYDFCGNWGWAIVLLTIIVRLALFPLSYKGMMGMQKLKDIAPQMKEIQSKYKNDPQKMQKQMMDLYRKHGANPLGGCLPLLLQIPVFFAIYKVLYCAVELKSAPWILWITDLSAIDPYYILPLVMGITMYISQILTPSSFTDPMQEKVFKFLPLIFTIFFIIFPFPAGLVLYWSVNNVISIFQQILINKIVEKQKGQR